MEKEENLTVLKDELKTICEKLIQQMHQIDGVNVPAETRKQKLAAKYHLQTS